MTFLITNSNATEVNQPFKSVTITVVQVSISSTFYAQLFFVLNCFFAAFLLLQFGFEFFWQNNICTKDARRKMLMKLTKGICTSSRAAAVTCNTVIPPEGN